MNFHKNPEEKQAEDKRKHEIAMSKLEIQKLKLGHSPNEWSAGMHAITWAGITLVLLIAGVTICNSVPTNIEKLKEENAQVIRRMSTISQSVDASAQNTAYITKAKAESIAIVKGFTSDYKTTSGSSDSSFKSRIHDLTNRAFEEPVQR